MRKEKQRTILATIMMFIMLIGCLVIPASGNTVEAAGKLKVSCSKKTIMVDSKTTIKTNVKARFASSNKKIATVNSKGVVKGKKPGKVKIKITSKSNKKQKKTITITVQAKPESTTEATTQTTTEVTTETPTTEKTTEAATTEIPSVVDKEYTIYDYNVTDDSELLSIIADTSEYSDYLKINVENDYVQLLFNRDCSELTNNNEFLKYLGKITATDKNGNDISDSIIIWNDMNDEIENGQRSNVVVYAKDSEGHAVVKYVYIYFTDEQRPVDKSEYTLINNNPEVYAINRIVTDK
jgi:hypothetical protein